MGSKPSSSYLLLKIWDRRDSNPRPRDYESPALPLRHSPRRLFNCQGLLRGSGATFPLKKQHSVVFFGKKTTLSCFFRQSATVPEDYSIVRDFCAVAALPSLSKNNTQLFFSAECHSPEIDILFSTNTEKIIISQRFNPLSFITALLRFCLQCTGYASKLPENITKIKHLFLELIWQFC